MAENMFGTFFRSSAESNENYRLMRRSNFEVTEAEAATLFATFSIFPRFGKKLFSR